MSTVKVYQDVGQALWSDAQDWLVTKHAGDITKLYERLFSEYLTERFGRIDPDTRRKLVKELLKNIIS